MAKALRIVLLEDNRLDAELLQAKLCRGGIDGEVRRVVTRDALVRALDGAPPDLILSDYYLPAFDGLSALEVARCRCPDVPFLFVSVAICEALVIVALGRGA